MLDEWQELILQAALGERSDSTWAAKQVGISVPRQNGKSQLLVARALAGALLFGEQKIVISAHQQDTARESFNKILDLIERDDNEWLRKRIKPNGVMQALNREAIRFTNGATMQFKARSGAGGRGFSSDCLMLDEAQILSFRAWVSINSTMSAMPNPQVWLLGTPPTPEDDGDVFASVRASAVEGKSTATAWLEWAADPDADPALEETRWSANPAWTTRINHEVVQGEFETYPPDRFALDRLGVWRGNSSERVVPADIWNALADEGPASDVPPNALAVDMSPDRVIAISACWIREDSHHVELVAVDRAQDTLAAAEWLIARAGRHIPVVVDSFSPAARMIPALEAAKVQVQTLPPTGTEMGKACGLFYEDVMAGRLTHAAQDQLDRALAGAKKRGIRDAGSWAWDRKSPEVNIAPLVSVTLARYGATQQTKKPSTSYAF